MTLWLRAASCDYFLKNNFGLLRMKQSAAMVCFQCTVFAKDDPAASKV
ncbi:MAG: hypothetical protein ACLSH6_10790 [Limosilactobacillus pontis]